MKNIGMGCGFENAKELLSKHGISALVVPVGPDEMCVKKHQMQEFCDDILARDLIPYDAVLITHGPVWHNLCNKENRNATFFHLKMMVEYASMLNVTQFVVHPGHKGKLDSFEAFNNCIEFLADFIPILEATGVKLVLENSAGSANGSKFGSMVDIGMIMDVLRSKHVGYCFDSAHAYANGEPVDSLTYWQDKVGNATLIHLNCPDAKVRFGSHFDRHSATSLANWNNFFSPESLEWVFCKFGGDVVLEAMPDIALSDIMMLRERYGHQV